MTQRMHLDCSHDAVCRATGTHGIAGTHVRMICGKSALMIISHSLSGQQALPSIEEFELTIARAFASNTSICKSMEICDDMPSLEIRNVLVVD